MSESTIALSAWEILRASGERTEARLHALVDHFLGVYPGLDAERAHAEALALAKKRGTL